MPAGYLSREGVACPLTPPKQPSQPLGIVMDLSREADEITHNAWLNAVAIESGQRTMAVALILRRKGYPRVHVGAGRVAGPGASAWLAVLQWASEDLLLDIALNAEHHPDLPKSPAFLLALLGQRSG